MGVVGGFEWWVGMGWCFDKDKRGKEVDGMFGIYRTSCVT
jgi:hypothetical protein